jgi:signal transduction histidine kinase
MNVTAVFGERSVLPTIPLFSQFADELLKTIAEAGRASAFDAGEIVFFSIVVRDYGRGMSAASRSRVFEPFYTTGRGQGGTGLGMAIVHNLVTSALKGHIELTSGLGQGTAVRVTFPKRIPD